MKRVGLAICLAVVCVAAVMNAAWADTFGSGTNQFTIDFVSIGHPGSGAVGYNYRIGTYDVTNAQWNAFTATAGAPTGNPSYAYDESAYFTGAQQPTNYVSWYEAAQFCNYLTSGNKSLGAYQLGTDGSITVNRAVAILTYGMAYVIPTEDEWYKAAYFKPDGSGYSLYANGTNTAPIAGVDTNYNNVIGHPWDVGSGTMEQNGTFDMMGNVYQWNETSTSNGYYDFRGGKWNETAGTLGSNVGYFGRPYMEYGGVGFRVASIPEPATMMLLGLGGMFLRSRKF